uniref:Ovule protein n=1 Tax=Ditylenchus dipsaci TaxID=166011 RepID=A0A915DHS3_9BILA
MKKSIGLVFSSKDLMCLHDYFFAGINGSVSHRKLHVFHVSTTLRELFYQLVIFSFGNMGSCRLHPSDCLVNSIRAREQ